MQDTATDGKGSAGKAAPLLAASVLRIFPKTLRIYSIAVAGDCRGKGYGQLMLDHALSRARKLGKTTASLEADAANPALLRWYGNNGFEITRRLPDYYGKRQDGVRMHLRL